MTDVLRAQWGKEPRDDDYNSAAAYLSLLADSSTVNGMISRLRSVRTEQFKAKDILRAARLSLLDIDNPHVANSMHKIASGVALSPVLVVRGDVRNGRDALIADGYHRLCASFHVDEAVLVAAKVINAPTPEYVRIG